VPVSPTGSVTPQWLVGLPHRRMSPVVDHTRLPATVCLLCSHALCIVKGAVTCLKGDLPVHVASLVRPTIGPEAIERSWMVCVRDG